MSGQQKIEELREIIYKTIPQLIAGDYWLLDLPFHSNVGDVLIWQGELDFLKHIPHKCKGMFSANTFPRPVISKDDIILFHGGGNFGDLWTGCHNFRLETLRKYPNNKFIYFPQTVYFASKAELASSAEELAKHDVTICARDEASFEILKNNFKNKVFLVPDMAFAIDMAPWAKSFHTTRPLLMMRRDFELKTTPELERLKKLSGVELSDWKTWNHRSPAYVLFVVLMRLATVIPFFKRVFCWYNIHLYRPHCIRSGVQLINGHTECFVTRMHAAILSVLLGKKVVLFDNTYGKCRNFYDTWLKDCDLITMNQGEIT